MLRRVFWIISVLILGMTSCESNKILNEKIRDFEENRWNPERDLTFNFTIENKGLYQADMFISHVYGYHAAQIPVSAEIIDANGKSEKLDVTFIIKDNTGKDLGDCAGDYCDVWQPLFEAKEFEAGNYTIKLSHKADGPYLPNILSVGLKVKNQ